MVMKQLRRALDIEKKSQSLRCITRKRLFELPADHSFSEYAWALSEVTFSYLVEVFPWPTDFVSEQHWI